MNLGRKVDAPRRRRLTSWPRLAGRTRGHLCPASPARLCVAEETLGKHALFPQPRPGTRLSLGALRALGGGGRRPQPPGKFLHEDKPLVPPAVGISWLQDVPGGRLSAVAGRWLPYTLPGTLRQTALKCVTLGDSAACPVAGSLSHLCWRVKATVSTGLRTVTWRGSEPGPCKPRRRLSWVVGH